MTKTKVAPDGTGATMMDQKILGKRRSTWLQLIETRLLQVGDNGRHRFATPGGDRIAAAAISSAGQLRDDLHDARSKLLEPNGKFGECEGDGNPHKVGTSRLQLNPGARLCMSCQEAADDGQWRRSVAKRPR